jgi:hypothetical protein
MTMQQNLRGVFNYLKKKEICKYQELGIGLWCLTSPEYLKICKYQ